jgi:hypothetical protein
MCYSIGNEAINNAIGVGVIQHNRDVGAVGGVMGENEALCTQLEGGVCACVRGGIEHKAFAQEIAWAVT